MRGYGYATIEFGNCASSGAVQLFLKGQMIEYLSGKGKMKVDFYFCDGDHLTFREINAGIILFSDFQYSCESEYLVFPT